MTKGMTARELDHEAYERRERLASTLDQLSASLTPGRVLDEILSYAKGGGGNFLLGLGKSASANPLPTLLISTGCALFLSGKLANPFSRAGSPTREKSSPTEYDRSLRGHKVRGPGVMSKAADAIAGAASGVADGFGSAASSVASAASNLGSRVAESAKDAVGTIADTASAAGDTVTNVGESARSYADDVAASARQTTEKAQRRATLLGRELNGKAAEAFNDYPLAVAAGGLLVGAALAALLPRSKVEDRLLGEKSDVLKGAFVEGAADGIERVVTGVEHVVDAVQAKAGEENIVGAAKESLDDLSAKVGKTLKAGKDAFDDELKAARKRQH